MSARIASKILIVVLLILIILIGALFATIEVFAEEIEYATLSDDEINSIVEEVNYREQSRNQSRVQLFSSNGSSEKKSSRTLIIRDFNEKKAFLYIEFDLGGYAIYDIFLILVQSWAEMNILYSRAGTLGTRASY